MYSREIYSTSIARLSLQELETRSGFVIGACNLHNIRYAADIMLMVYTERKLEVLSDRVVEESEKNGLTIN